MADGSGVPRIPKFYEGRSVFITGASGFLGKVLVERLLSTCPGIKKVFLLLREKNSMTPENRMNQLRGSKVFDVLRYSNPQQLDKLELIAGDVTQLDLGISPEDLQKLAEVSIFFHSAATVKFHEPLRLAVEQNLLSVIRVIDACQHLPALQALIQVSTAYSNPENRRVQERVYPAPVRLQSLINLLDNNNDDEIEEITPQFISPKPNTYAFTKAMAESVVAQRAGGSYSVAIFRPSIVISTHRHPFAGWQEKVQGPGLVVAAAGTGVMRVSLTEGRRRADMVPADICADGLIAVAWHTLVHRTNEVRVYNCTAEDSARTWGDFCDVANRAIIQYPFDKALWYPHITCSNSYKFLLFDFLMQRLPLYTLEYLKRLLGIKSRINFIDSYHKCSKVNEVLSYFSTNEWDFDFGNMKKLRESLSLEDRKLYNLDPKTIDWEELLTNFVKGTKKYALKEKDEDLPKARKRLHRLRILHNSTRFIGILMVIRFILKNKYIKKFINKLVYYLAIKI